MRYSDEYIQYRRCVFYLVSILANLGVAHGLRQWDELNAFIDRHKYSEPKDD